MRVLILSCNTGEGHNSCAKAIQERYIAHGDACDIEDALRFISPTFSRFIAWGHATMYRRFAWLFKWGYSYSEQHPAVFDDDSGIYKLLTSGVDRLYEFVKFGNYDAVITVHVFTALILTELLKRHPMDIPTSFVATDYTCSPSMEQSKLDLYFIPHKSLTYDFESPNVPQSKLVCSGIPIRQAFYQKNDAVKAKQTAGVSEELPHLLMMCGSMGCGPMKRLVRLLDREDGLELTVVCGTNQKLYRKLERRYDGHDNIHIRGYEKNMPLLMDSADLYLTKPGGLSVTEAYVKELPMVCIDAVAGCEEYNRNFFLRMGAAKTGRNVRQLRDLCLRLLADRGLLEEMRKTMQSAAACNAAETIYQTICEACIRSEALSTHEQQG